MIEFVDGRKLDELAPPALRLVPKPETFTRAEAETDPWAVVAKAIPHDASPALLAEAYDNLRYLIDEAIDWPAARANPAWPAGYVGTELARANAKLAELDARLDELSPFHTPMRNDAGRGR